MKRNIIRVVLLAVFAFVAGYGVYTSQKETAMSDLAMANVEALAYSVEDGNGNVMYECNPVSGTCSYELGMAIPGKKK